MWQVMQAQNLKCYITLEKSCKIHRYRRILIRYSDKNHNKWFLKLRMAWKSKIKCAAFAFAAFYPNFTSVFFNKFFAKQQSQSGAGFAFSSFSVGIGINPEQVVNHLPAHSNTCILNGYHDVFIAG